MLSITWNIELRPHSVALQTLYTGSWLSERKYSVEEIFHLLQVCAPESLYTLMPSTFIYENYFQYDS